MSEEPIRISKKRLRAILETLEDHGVIFVQNVGPSNAPLLIDEVVAFFFDPVEALRDICDMTRAEALDALSLRLNQRASRFPGERPSL